MDNVSIHPSMKNRKETVKIVRERDLHKLTREKPVKILRSTIEAHDRGVVGNRGKYMSWVKTHFPKIYAAAIKHADESNQEEKEVMGDSGEWFSSFADFITKSGNAALDLRERKAAIDLQTKRALSDQPPAETVVTEDNEMLIVEKGKGGDLLTAVQSNAIPLLAALGILWFLVRKK